MNIEHEKNSAGGAFYIEEEGNRLAEITYKLSGEAEMTIDHTEVDDKFRGEGIGQDLVAKAVDFARSENLKVRPTCPYARKVIERTPAMQDVLA